MTAEIIGFDPPLATVGSKIAFQVEIANRGTGAFAGSIELQFILEATIQGVLTTIPIAHRSVVTIDSLAHGATARQGVKDVQIPKDIAPHIYSVKMRLDPDNLIQEDSESNNESTTPNLIVQGFRLTGSTLRLADHTPEAGVAVDVYRISDLISSVRALFRRPRPRPSEAASATPRAISPSTIFPGGRWV